VAPSESVYSAIRLMSAHNIGALPVCDGSHVLGILSERDCVRRVMQQQRDASSTVVSGVMTGHVISVQSGDTIEHCMGVMTTRRVRHLPVIDHGKLVGMVSVGDIVKAKLAAQEATIADLERYIQGAPHAQLSA
jgi:CBS domain-containing protein